MMRRKYQHTRWMPAGERKLVESIDCLLTYMNVNLLKINRRLNHIEALLTQRKTSRNRKPDPP